jgi:hypothetical protein
VFPSKFTGLFTAISTAALVGLTLMVSPVNAAQAATGTTLGLSNTTNGTSAYAPKDVSGQQLELSAGNETEFDAILVGKVSLPHFSPFTIHALDQEYANHPYFEFKDMSATSLCLGQQSGLVELKPCATSGTIYWVITDYGSVQDFYYGRLLNVERSDYVGTAQAMYTIGPADTDRLKINTDGTTGDWESWSFFTG